MYNLSQKQPTNPLTNLDARVTAQVLEVTQLLRERAQLARQDGNWRTLSMIESSQIPGRQTFARIYDPEREMGRWYVALMNAEIVSPEEATLIKKQAKEAGRKTFASKMTKSMSVFENEIALAVAQARLDQNWRNLALSQWDGKTRCSSFIRRLNTGSWYDALEQSGLVTSEEKNLIVDAAAKYKASKSSVSRKALTDRKIDAMIVGIIKPLVEQARESNNWRPLHSAEFSHPVRHSLSRRQGEINWHDLLVKLKLVTAEERELIEQTRKSTHRTISDIAIKPQKLHVKQVVEIVRREQRGSDLSFLEISFTENEWRSLTSSATIILPHRHRFVGEVHFPVADVLTPVERLPFQMGGSSPYKWEKISETYANLLPRTANYFGCEVLMRHLVDLNNKGTIVAPERMASVGAGPGTLHQVLQKLQSIHLLPNSYVIDIDPSENMRRLSPNPRTMEGSAHSIPLESESVDALECSVIRHLSQRSTALMEFNRVLRKDGLLLLRLNGHLFDSQWEGGLKKLGFTLINQLNTSFQLPRELLKRLPQSYQDKIRLALSTTVVVIAKKLGESRELVSNDELAILRQTDQVEELKVINEFRRRIATKAISDKILVRNVSEFCNWLGETNELGSSQIMKSSAVILGRALRRLFFSSEVSPVIFRTDSDLAFFLSGVRNNIGLIEEARRTLSEVKMQDSVALYLNALHTGYQRILDLLRE